MVSRFLQKTRFLLSLLPVMCLLACSAGVSGGGGERSLAELAAGSGIGENPSNFSSATGDDPNSNDSSNFNSPTVAGREGDSQESPKRFTITVGFKDGPSNCGNFSENAADIFPAVEEDSPQLNASFGGGEGGPFFATQVRSMGGKGRMVFDFSNGSKNGENKSCPQIVRKSTPQVILNEFIVVAFAKIQVTYTDPNGKFFQSESKVLDCSVESCAVRPCEVCLTLEEKPIEDSASAQNPEPNNPANFQIPTRIDRSGTNINRGNLEINSDLLNNFNLSPHTFSK